MGEKLILCIDDNEDMRKGDLFNNSLSKPELGMQEAISSHHPNLPVMASFCTGSRQGQLQIDRVWVTPDLPIEAGSWLAFHKAPRDHHYGILKIY